MRVYTYAEVKEDIEKTESLTIGNSNQDDNFKNFKFLKLYSQLYLPMCGEATINDFHKRLGEFYNRYEYMIPYCDDQPDGNYLFNIYASSQEPKNWQEFCRIKFERRMATNDEMEAKRALDSIILGDADRMMFIVYTELATVDHKQAPPRHLH